MPIVDTDDLRQLVPCAASHNLAIELHERAIEGRQSELICVAVCSAHSRESATDSFSTSLWTRLVRPGLMIRIDGPGELRVSEGHCAWHLQAGKLFNLGSATVPPLPQWLDKAAQLSKANVGIETRLKNTIHFAWHEIVHLISEQRCGGCLVILPTTGLTGNKVEAEYDIRLKACTDGPRLGREIADFVQFCSTTETIANLDEFRGVSNRWLSELHRLLSHVDSLAQISAIDGCTVFDAALQLVGFGGRIDVGHDAHTVQLVDAASGNSLDTDIMGRTGTRHLSAFQLCEAHSDVWCYVVSQDGQATAFWNDGKVVKRWFPYWPWANTANQF